MTKAEHIARHKELHRALDELVADWIGCGETMAERPRLPSKWTIMELIQWSHQQTIDPEEPRLK